MLIQNSTAVDTKEYKMKEETTDEYNLIIKKIPK